MLGRPAREVWSEIWDVLGPLLKGVIATGEAFRAIDHPFYLERHGFAEETYFDVSYDPVRDETGEVGGVFCIVSETTGRVLSERRLRTLRDLGRAKEGRSAAEACAPRPAPRSPSNRQDIPFASLYLLDAAGAVAHARGVGRRRPPGGALSPATIALDDPRWALGAVAPSGRRAALTDAAVAGDRARAARRAPLRTARWSSRSCAAGQCAGFMVAGTSRFLALEGDYRDFFDLVAAQIGDRGDAGVVLRGGAPARRGAGRARPREDDVLQQHQPRVPHAADADARARSRISCTRAGRPRRRTSETLVGDPPQRPAPAQAGQHAARLLAHPGGPSPGGVRADRPRRVHARSWPASSARRSSRRGCAFDVRCPSGPRARVRRSRRCGRRSSSTSSPTRSSSPSRARSRVELADRGASVELVVRDTGIGIAPPRSTAIFDRFHRVESARGAHPRGLGHRPRAGPGAGAPARRRRAGGERAGSGQRVHGDAAARAGAPARRPHRDGVDGAAAAAGVGDLVRARRRWAGCRTPTPPSDVLAARAGRRPTASGARPRRASWSPTTTRTCASTSPACSARGGTSRRWPTASAALAALRAAARRPRAGRRDDAAGSTGSAAARRARRPRDARHPRDPALGAGRRGVARRGPRGRRRRLRDQAVLGARAGGPRGGARSG